MGRLIKGLVLAALLLAGPAAAVPSFWSTYPIPAFVPVTHTYVTGSSATENVPVGASQAVITVDGSGGGAGQGTTNSSAGGGGGAEVIYTCTVTTGDSFTYTVGVGGTWISGHNGTNGTDSLSARAAARADQSH